MQPIRTWLSKVKLVGSSSPTLQYYSSSATTRSLATNRVRLSKLWLPTVGFTAPSDKQDGHSKLLRAGYLRQSHAGIFHMLPLGQRVQEKLEKLIDKHMQQVGALKVSLSSLSSQALWEKTNRLEGYGPELFKFNDRKETGYILAPTHEEEITSIFSAHLSYKNLPLRIYQIGRKYRDELRPRHGLLRSREFVMKDLYTFDADVESALQTYSEVRAAYSRLFDELRLPYLVAEASSGDIGGDLSHEYHLASSVGEDNVISCDNCSYVANEELAEAKITLPGNGQETSVKRTWYGITKDRTTLVAVDFATSSNTTFSSINTHAVKSIIPNLDTSIDDARPWVDGSGEGGKHVSQTVYLVDQSYGHKAQQIDSEVSEADTIITQHPKTGAPLSLLRIQDGDSCARCESGKLHVQKAVELGHTFHLGTRYSEPLDAKVRLRENVSVPMQMGCHGIGVSRIIGAIADHLADKKGLNWPRAICPYEVVVIGGRHTSGEDVNLVYDHLAQHNEGGGNQPLEVVLDDRAETFAWKMNDADAVGYPIVVLLGRGWGDGKKVCEVQCRRLSVKESVQFDDLHVYIGNLLSQL